MVTLTNHSPTMINSLTQEIIKNNKKKYNIYYNIKYADTQYCFKRRFIKPKDKI